MSEGQDGMIESRGRQDVDLGHAEVGVDVLIWRVGGDVGMSRGILLGLVDPRVERGHVDVLDLFVLALVDVVMESDGVGSSPEEGVSGMEWFDDFVGGEELFEVVVGLGVAVPVTFPHGDDRVPLRF